MALMGSWPAADWRSDSSIGLRDGKGSRNNLNIMSFTAGFARPTGKGVPGSVAWPREAHRASSCAPSNQTHVFDTCLYDSVILGYRIVGTG